MILGVPRWKALMARRSTTWLRLSRLVSVSICLFAFAVLPLPELIVLTLVEATEAESHSQEERESSEGKLVVCSSARRRLNYRRHSDLSRAHENGNQLHQIASYAGRLPAIVGHQLANGLGAPLLI